MTRVDSSRMNQDTVQVIRLFDSIRIGLMQELIEFNLSWKSVIVVNFLVSVAESSLTKLKSL